MRSGSAKVTIKVQRSNGVELGRLERSAKVAAQMFRETSLVSIKGIEYVVESYDWDISNPYFPVATVVVNLSDASKQRFGISA